MRGSVFTQFSFALVSSFLISQPMHLERSQMSLWQPTTENLTVKLLGVTRGILHDKIMRVYGEG